MRDKRGRRFGFWRFFKVVDERLFVTKLDNIFIDHKKLHANTAKYNRDKYARRIPREEIPPTKKSTTESPHNKAQHDKEYHKLFITKLYQGGEKW